jgi:hypothetical protein
MKTGPFARSDLDLRFGGQLTVDQILNREETLRDLHRVGLDYIFIGIETLEPLPICGMDKDLGNGAWIDRTERALEILRAIGIKCGGSLLFGLGETHDSRIKLLRRIQQWQARYGSPSPISLNWAVQHPHKGADNGANYLYYEWGIPPGPWLEAFRDFGEASVLYPLAGQKLPVLEEIQEIGSLYRSLMSWSLDDTLKEKGGNS